MDEGVNKLYAEMKKEFIKDVIKIFNTNCPEYLNEHLKGFLDGLSTSGECIVYITLDEHNAKIKEFEVLHLKEAEMTDSKTKEIYSLHLKLNTQIEELKQQHTIAQTGIKILNDKIKNNDESYKKLLSSKKISEAKLKKTIDSLKKPKRNWWEFLK